MAHAGEVGRAAAGDDLDNVGAAAQAAPRQSLPPQRLLRVDGVAAACAAAAGGPSAWVAGRHAARGLRARFRRLLRGATAERVGPVEDTSMQRTKIQGRNTAF